MAVVNISQFFSWSQSGELGRAAFGALREQLKESGANQEQNSVLPGEPRALASSEDRRSLLQSQVRFKL